MIIDSKLSEKYELTSLEKEHLKKNKDHYTLKFTTLLE